MSDLLNLIPNLIDGLLQTLNLFIIVAVISIPLGFLITLSVLYGPKIVQLLLNCFIYVMRGTPLLLQLMVIFFGLPLLGLKIDRFPSALLAYCLNYAAYYAEIFRGGMLSIPLSQFEAIKVLNIKKVRGYRRIILPQLFKTTLPSVTNELITLVKDTSLVYVIGLTELLKVGKTAANASASLVPFLAVGLLYLLITAIITLAVNVIEEKLEF